METRRKLIRPSSGTYFPLGAAFFSNASWPETVAVVNQTGVPAEPIYLNEGARQQFYFDYQNGTTSPLEPFPTPFIQALFEEFPRYVAQYTSEFEPIVRPGYKSGVPESLTVPAAQWFRENNYTAIPIAIVDPIALYGYGDINNTPMLYVFQYMTPDVLTAFAGLHPVYLIDFHAVWEKFAAQNITGAVNTNTNITKIDRSGKYIKLYYANKDHDGGDGPWDGPGNWGDNWGGNWGGNKRGGGGWGEAEWGWISPWGKHDKECWQPCSDLVLAFPPTLINLQMAGLDLTPQETAVFEPVTVTNYYSSAVNFSGLPLDVSYIGASNITAGQPPPDVGEPVAGLRLHSDSTIVTWWSWGPRGVFQNMADAYDLLISTLSQINKDPRTNETSIPVTAQDVRAFRQWDYFPRYDTEQLAQGYFAKFNALQGTKRTFYASGFNDFESVEWALRAGKDIANSYF